MSDRPDDPSPEEDRLLAAIEAAQRAAEAAAWALAPVRAVLEGLRRRRAVGMPLPFIVDSYLQAAGEDTRREAAAAFRGYEHAFMTLRAELVRRLVEEDRYTLTEVAKTLGISRQLVARLLETARLQA